MYKPETIFVTVGAGRAVPLPIPGGGSVPGLGGYIARTLEVERLLANGDLVITDAPAPAAEPVTEAATSKPAKGV